MRIACTIQFATGLSIAVVALMVPLIASAQIGTAAAPFESYLLNPTSIRKDCPSAHERAGVEVFWGVYKCVEDSALRGLLVRLGEQGNAKAIDILVGYYLLNDGDHTQTVYWLRKQIALSSNENAEIWLADQLLIHGIDPHEIDEGFALAERLSEAGNLRAKSLLAEYLTDRKLPRRALVYQRELAETGNVFDIELLVKALLRLAQFNRRHYVEACMWSRIGAARAKPGSWFEKSFPELSGRAEKPLKPRELDRCTAWTAKTSEALKL